VTGVNAYRALFALPYARALIGWSLVGRLPVGMTPIALLFLVRGEGEGYGAAGAVVAVYAVALGGGAPVGGRQVDRFGPRRVLQVRTALFSLLVGVIVALALVDAGIVPIAAAAALAGLSMPPLSSTVRVVLPRIAPGDLRATAYSLEASLQEVHFVGGPLLASALAAIDPVIGIAGAAVGSLLGTTMVARLPPVRETPRSREAGAGALGALGSPGVRTIVLYAAIAGVAFGSVELAMPAFAEAEVGRRELGGIALACFSGGSLLGGLLAGLRPAVTVLRRFLLGAVALAAAMVGLQLAVSLPLLYVLAFVAGLPIAPTIGALYTLIDRSARPGTAAEAFAWFGTAVSIGIAAGAAIAGVLVDERGVRWAFGLGAATALVGALLGWARQGALVQDRARRDDARTRGGVAHHRSVPPGGLEPPT
jgi:MFS family permease